MRSAEVRRAERAWLTRELSRGRSGLDAAWVVLVLLNLVAIAIGLDAAARPGEGSEFEIRLPVPLQA